MEAHKIKLVEEAARKHKELLARQRETIAREQKEHEAEQTRQAENRMRVVTIRLEKEKEALKDNVEQKTAAEERAEIELATIKERLRDNVECYNARADEELAELSQVPDVVPEVDDDAVDNRVYQLTKEFVPMTLKADELVHYLDFHHDHDDLIIVGVNTTTLCRMSSNSAT